MTQHASVPPPTAPGPTSRPRSTLRQDAVAALLAAWLVLGMFLDGRAHLEGLIGPDGESFFSIWHLILYSGFLALAVWVFRIIGGFSGIRDRTVVPAGYGLAALGVPLFLLSGQLDMVWHLAWGFEDGLESAMSPPHVLLVASGVLLITGPVRAAWHGSMPAAPRLRAFLPAAVAFGLALAVVLSWSSALLRPLPWSDPVADAQLRGYFDLILYEKVLLANLMLMAATLLVLKSWKPPLGTFAVVYGLVGVLHGIEDNFQITGSIVAFALAGVLVDVVVRRLYPPQLSTWSLVRFGFLIPVVVWSCYLAAIAVFHGLRWSHQMWSGIIVLAALCGGLLAFIVAKPFGAGLREGAPGTPSADQRAPTGR